MEIGFAIVRPDGFIQKSYDRVFRTSYEIYTSREAAEAAQRLAFPYPGFSVVEVHLNVGQPVQDIGVRHD